MYTDPHLLPAPESGHEPERAHRAWAVAGLLALAAGCFTPAELRDRADRDAFALIDSRRNQLFGEDTAFALPTATAAFGRGGTTEENWTLREQVLAGAVGGVGPVNVVDALMIAAENSETYQREQEALYLSSLDLTLEQWRFGYRYDAAADGSTNGTIGGDVGSASTGFSASVTKVLGTGAVILADVGTSLFRFVSTGDGWDAISNVGISITQPLLRGTGKLVTLEPLRQTERDLVYTVRGYERFRRTFAVDVTERVYRVQQALDQLNNETLNNNNLVTLRERNEALARAGRLSKVQVDQARQDELSSNNRLVILIGNTQRQLDTFKVFLGLPVQTELTFEEGILLNIAVDDSLLRLLDDDVAVEFAIDYRLDVMTAFDRVQDATRREAIARDALRAGLGLSAGVNSVSAEGRIIDYEFDDAIWNVGLDIDLPIDLLPERNTWRRSEITLVDTTRRYERFLDDVTVSVRDALRNARNALESFRIAENAVILGDRRIEGVLLNYDAGTATTRDVLEAQDSQRRNRDAATSARIDFTLSSLQLWLELEILRIDESGTYIDADMVSELRARLGLPQDDDEALDDRPPEPAEESADR